MEREQTSPTGGDMRLSYDITTGDASLPRFAVVPMMDWIESIYISIDWKVMRALSVQ